MSREAFASYQTAYAAIVAVGQALRSYEYIDRDSQRPFGIALDALRPVVAALPEHPDFQHYRALLVRLIDAYADLIRACSRRRAIRGAQVDAVDTAVRTVCGQIEAEAQRIALSAGNAVQPQWL